MSLSHSISKNSLLLFGFAIVAAGLLSATYQGTKDTIAEAERRAAEKALLEIIPASRIDNNLLLDTLKIPEFAAEQLGLSAEEEIHIARKNGEIIAVIVPAIAPDGYSGDVKMIVGVNANGSIAGVRVLTHGETPGLGDKIDLKKSDWITSFKGKSLERPSPELWKVKKDGGAFDQFTGATITPRAVVKQVREVLEFVKANEKRLFDKIDQSNPADS
ncbi:MAG: electron transport complex protein RnfG [Cellvibrionaceae bacterium]|jgi:electron transport complex protein RnfG